MMKYTIYVPQNNVPILFAEQQLAINFNENQPATTQSRAQFYPLHSSLEDEMKRLFSPPVAANWSESRRIDVMDEFRNNGRDFEYLTEEEESEGVKIAPKKKKNKKPLPTECVFCKNNGEEIAYYRNHILKDNEGKVLCPILRKYTCPICGARGDNSHTLKYCPENTKGGGPITSAIKVLRNATGRKGRAK